MLRKRCHRREGGYVSINAVAFLIAFLMCDARAEEVKGDPANFADLALRFGRVAYDAHARWSEVLDPHMESRVSYFVTVCRVRGTDEKIVRVFDAQPHTKPYVDWNGTIDWTHSFRSFLAEDPPQIGPDPRGGRPPRHVGPYVYTRSSSFNDEVVQEHHRLLSPREMGFDLLPRDKYLETILYDKRQLNPAATPGRDAYELDSAWCLLLPKAVEESTIEKAMHKLVPLVVHVGVGHIAGEPAGIAAGLIAELALEGEPLKPIVVPMPTRTRRGAPGDRTIPENGEETFRNDERGDRLETRREQPDPQELWVSGEATYRVEESTWVATRSEAGIQGVSAEIIVSVHVQFRCCLLRNSGWYKTREKPWVCSTTPGCQEELRRLMASRKSLESTLSKINKELSDLRSQEGTARFAVQMAESFLRKTPRFVLLRRGRRLVRVTNPRFLEAQARLEGARDSELLRQQRRQETQDRVTALEGELAMVRSVIRRVEQKIEKASRVAIDGRRGSSDTGLSQGSRSMPTLEIPIRPLVPVPDLLRSSSMPRSLGSSLLRGGLR